MTSTNRITEAERLEQLWSGSFGNDYVDCRPEDHAERAGFWLPLIEELQPASVLEVGCNAGANLQWIAERVPPARVVGVDVNSRALRLLEERAPGVRAMHAPARDLPFADRSFDLVFTVGLLTHQPEETLIKVMSEMVRVAKRLVFCAESYAPETTEVRYRGQEGAWFQRDYGNLFEELFPHELLLLREGLFSPSDGWDGENWWLFSRS